MSAISGDEGAEGAAVDLFGAPVGAIKERWGRPSFRKSSENQELVALLRAAGWSQARIARYLGCDEKTLRKHFSRELDHGVDLIEGMALQVMLKRMRSGHSVSTLRLLEICDAKGHPAPPPKPVPPKPAPLGKKETALIEAHTAHEGTEWGQLLQ